MNPVAEQKPEVKIEAKTQTVESIQVHSPVEIHTQGNTSTMMQVVKRSGEREPVDVPGKVVRDASSSYRV
jgi:hypothetical protein